MGTQRIVDALGPSAPWVLLQVDVSNAFNTVSREAMLERATQKVPTTAPWLHWCYSVDAPLFCQGKLLCHSRAGVHQGDAMGPLGFALGLDRALNRCQDQAT